MITGKAFQRKGTVNEKSLRLAWPFVFKEWPGGRLAGQNEPGGKWEGGHEVWNDMVQNLLAPTWSLLLLWAGVFPAALAIESLYIHIFWNDGSGNVLYFSLTFFLGKIKCWKVFVDSLKNFEAGLWSLEVWDVCSRNILWHSVGGGGTVWQEVPVPHSPPLSQTHWVAGGREFLFLGLTCLVSKMRSTVWKNPESMKA